MWEDNIFIITVKILIAIKRQQYVKSFQDSWVAHLVKKCAWISKMLKFKYNGNFRTNCLDNFMLKTA